MIAATLGTACHLPVNVLVAVAVCLDEAAENVSPLIDRVRVLHVDLYRLSSAAEFDSIGFEEILTAKALVLVEWADRAKGLLPHGHVPIDLEHIPGDPDRRLLLAGGHT